MVFRRFRVQVVLRVLGILATAMAFTWSIYETEFLMTPIVFGLFTLLQAIWLMIYTEKGTRQMSMFLQSFFDQDYTRKFEPKYEGKVFKELSNTFNNLLREYSRLSLEKEGQYQYVKIINEHVQVALISFKADGKIDLMNKTAQSLFNSPLLYRIEDLKNYEPELYNLIDEIRLGGRELYKSPNLNLAVAAKHFRLAGEEYTMVALQDISSELQANELEAWQKLIRVLTHEIMNSMTPVLSLSTAIKHLVTEEDQARSLEAMSQQDVSDIAKSISAIEKRGDGLLKFVNAYRDYTKTPELQLEKVFLSSLVKEVITLMENDLSEAHMKLSFVEDREMREVMLDQKLISQVLINLIKNAKEALVSTQSPEIKIALKNYSDRTSLTISDNGSGIPEEIRGDIFVPFFTTKKDGSGIGLSLSKQIMKAHGGDLSLEPKVQGTEFVLTFHGL